jgi:CRISPR-associated protein Cas1
MYQVRFLEPLDDALTLQQIRGREGVRVREAYQRASRESGVPWTGRTYKRHTWEHADPINRALSAANSCLYGVCHAAIVAAGYSPALGFVHTGKMLSFVYDIADLYKADLTVPAAFRAVSEGEIDLEGRVRRQCRDVFHQDRLLERIMPDIDRVLLGDGTAGDEALLEEDMDTDAALPGGLWDPETGVAPGGVNHSDLSEDVVGQLEAEVKARLGPIAPGRRVVITGGEWPQANRDDGA